MKRTHRTLCAAWIFGLLWLTSRLALAQTTAFYYGASVPPEIAASYDQVVVQPDRVSLADVQQHGAAAVAYLSVGEMSEKDARSADPSWIIAHNASWSTSVMDPRQPGYRAHLLRRLDALWERGFRRYFLDTLDSYQLGAKTAQEREQLRLALVQLVREMAARHHETKLTLNRGFELLPDVAGVVQGVVAESLFDRWDAGAKAYVPVPEADSAWLLARLRETRDRYRLPITVVDYRPPRERAEARMTARRIAALGFSPWVTDATLATVGMGPFEIIPRRVLLLTDGGPSVEAESLRLLSPVLEHLGYFAEPWDIVHAGVPPFELAGRYGGVVTWFHEGRLPSTYGPWLLSQVQSGVHFAMLGVPGLDLGGPEARALGIQKAKPEATPRTLPLRAVYRDELIGFEAEPPARPLEGPSLELVGDVQPHLRLADANGRECTAIATTWWGGLGLSHLFAVRGLHGERAWVVNPFEFLRGALKVPAFPRPDLTTENGRRVAVLVLRPQGLADTARVRGRPRVASLLRDTILRRFPWPHTLDLGSDETTEASTADRKEAERLLALPFAQPGHVKPGTTDVRPGLESLTRIAAPSMPTADGVVATPIAPDLAYLPSGAAEAYSYEQVLRTFEITDTPRRLLPIGLDYHAYVVSSYGGQRALGRIYAWLREHSVYPLQADEYEARVRAFRAQVVLRTLDGGFEFRGGTALRTVRLSDDLGYADLSQSVGISVFRELPQGRYVTFREDAPSRLILSSSPPLKPYLIQSSGQVRLFQLVQHETAGNVQIRLRIQGASPVEFAVANLPAATSCRIESRSRSMTYTTDGSGILLANISERDTGDAVLRCRESGGLP